MTPIRVLGDRDTVLAFQLGGVPGQVVQTAAEARAALDAAVAEVHREGGPARRPVLLLVTHGTAERIREDLDRAMLDPAGPLVLEIPGLGEATGERPVERFVERVLGLHL
ncbi:MAG TPA: V-type ATP synthase subunit F [Candidatus Dormibacteraeota bacterium]|nr:V-type ATP synthase subunit F [Candidatus Dormibacteraeota bacterium]